MAVAFDTVKPGDILLDVHSQRMGNTTMREQGVWKVRVISVDAEKRTALCSWNGNRAETYTESQFRSLRRVAPEWLTRGWNGKRCLHCGASKADGHNPTCDHPRAIAARKKAR